MYKNILLKYPQYKDTCPINVLQDGCFTFIRNESYLRFSLQKDVIVLAPNKIRNEVPSGWQYEFVDNVDYIFTMIHNTLHTNTIPLPNIIGKNCFIHPTAVLDVEGMHVTKTPDGNRVQIKHLGNVVIEDGVSIFAVSTLQRAVFGSTIIKQGTKIDSHVNIGHNSYIGKNTVIALGTIIGGSVRVGNNCMIGLGAIIRNGVSICDNVIVGMGSNIVSDITESGIYKGSPAKFYKPYSEDWNF